MLLCSHERNIVSQWELMGLKKISISLFFLKKKQHYISKVNVVSFCLEINCLNHTIVTCFLCMVHSLSDIQSSDLFFLQKKHTAQCTFMKRGWNLIAKIILQRIQICHWWLFDSWLVLKVVKIFIQADYERL